MINGAPRVLSLDTISGCTPIVRATHVPARCRDRPASREANLPLLDGKEVF